MSKYILENENGLVGEIIPYPFVNGRDADLKDKYHPDIFNRIRVVPDNVEPGWEKVNGVWVEPAPPKPLFKDMLRAKFAQIIAANKADLSDAQLAEVMERAGAIANSYGDYEQLLGPADHKRCIIGLINRISSLPANKDPVKQEMIQFINANYPVA